MLIFKSEITKKLTKKNIKDICRLKETYWKFSLKSQLNYFKKNIKQNDLHNYCYIDKKLIGYTLLKFKTFKMSNKNIKFLHFDTIIIDKDYRNKKIGNKLMLFNNDVITINKLKAFLICSKKMKDFYKKNFWKIADKKYNKINISKVGFNLMTFS